MMIFPAVDIKGGKCVRLLQGKLQHESVYGDPVQMALFWQNQGAKYLHVVDLDGAFTGQSGNAQAVGVILQAVNIPVQLGGGIRTMQQIQAAFSLGVSRVILGTAAVEQPQLVQAAVQAFPGKIICGIDAADGWVALQGWTVGTKVSAEALARTVRQAGVDTVVVTDIARDGMKTGNNTALTAQLVAVEGLNVIASGGIGTLEDVLAVKQTGAHGVIIGKALYDGNFTLQQALEIGGGI